MPSLTYNGWLPFSQEVNKTADYSVLLTDSGTLFTTGGSATRTFTLPALASGVGGVWWFLNLQDQNMVITAPSNKLVADGNLTGTSGTYSTASHKIGSFCVVWMNAAGTFYYLANQGGTTITIS